MIAREYREKEGARWWDIKILHGQGWNVKVNIRLEMQVVISWFFDRGECLESYSSNDWNDGYWM